MFPKISVQSKYFKIKFQVKVFSGASVLRNLEVGYISLITKTKEKQTHISKKRQILIRRNLFPS